MSDWKWLLTKTFDGLQKLADNGSPVPEWVLGGGTSLMIAFQHRLSKDIDAFIDDPQTALGDGGGGRIRTCDKSVMSGRP